MSAIRLLPVAPTYGTATLTLAANAGNNETVTIGTTVYTFKTTLTGAAYEVLIGAAAADSCTNLASAINDVSGEGTTYGTNTRQHPYVTGARSGDTCVITATHLEGSGALTIATTETMANGSWGGSVMTWTGSATGAVPTAATDGVAVPNACDQALILLRSTGGSGTMTASPTIWGYHPKIGDWYKIGALNSGTAIAETSADKIVYVELLVGLRGFSRLACELASAGTNPFFEVWADCRHAETSTR